MIINKKMDLINCILYLNPEAKFSVWDLTGDYFGEANPVLLSNYRVDWSSINSNPCPSEIDISNCDSELVNQAAQDRKNNSIQTIFE